ncbi:MAG: TspO/MBR family protein [Pacificimonas sp.]|nr:TspO/MBR family protein [Pacificimonas sp.]
MTTTASKRRPMLIGAVIVAALGLAVGGLVQTGEGDFYQALIKPDLNPPSYLFGIVWPILYLLIGAAVGRVWAEKGHPLRGRALFWFAIQFALNLAWTPTFFGLELIQVALGVITALIVAAIATTFYFGRIDRVAPWLMVPYLAWITFAAILNLRIIQLNPGF